MKGGFVPAAIVAAAILAGGAAQAGEPFRLLLLERHAVKWGAPTLGTGARVSYAFVRARSEFPEARNCAAMLPFATLATSAELPEAHLRAEIAAAFDAWQAVAGIEFHYSDDAATADILVGALARPRGIAYANVAYRSPPAGADIASLQQALVCFNPAQRWTTGFDGDPTTFDVRYAAMHEIGHAIGLDHAGPAGQLMSFKYLERFRAPGPGDVAGAVALYGPRKAAGDRMAEAIKSVAGAAHRGAAMAPPR